MPTNPKIVSAAISYLLIFSSYPSYANDEKTLQRIDSVLMLKAICDIYVPGFQDKSAAAYSKWRQRNLEVVQQFERDPDSSSSKANKLTKEERMEMIQNEKISPLERSKFIESCNDELIEHLLWIAPDPRLNTPEGTWTTFLNALRSGDRKLAVSCLTSQARQNFRHQIMDVLSDEQLKSQAGAAMKLGAKWRSSFRPKRKSKVRHQETCSLKRRFDVGTRHRSPLIFAERLEQGSGATDTHSKN